MDHATLLHTPQVKGKHLESRKMQKTATVVTIFGSWDCVKGWKAQIHLPSLSAFLCTLFPQGTFSSFFALDLAHSMHLTRSPPGVLPRTFILRLLNFQDYDLVLREAQKMDVIHH